MFKRSGENILFSLACSFVITIRIIQLYTSLFVITSTVYLHPSQFSMPEHLILESGKVEPIFYICVVCSGPHEL